MRYPFYVRVTLHDGSTVRVPFMFEAAADAFAADYAAGDTSVERG